MNIIEMLFELYIPAILIIIALSFVFVDWPGWRWVEHLIVGSGTGVVLATNWTALQRSGISPLMAGEYILIIPIIFGIFLYFRFIPKYRWLQRYGFLWVIAGGMGVIIGGTFQGQILPQVIESIKILAPTPLDTINAIVMLIIFITTLSYFTYTVEHKGPLQVSAKLGRIFMMIGFGLGFSTLIQTYFGVLLERIQWILFKVFGLG
jgi:lipoprotein signal peptidase